MSEQEKSRPHTGPQAERAAAERAAREAAALRENLRRRKAQARQRGAQAPQREQDAAAEDSGKPHEVG
jgi:hypothetical protein